MTLDKAFNQLAYNLIYPAILGSIIFDLADPLRTDFPFIKVASYLICYCFIVDYLHMTLNLCNDGQSKHKYGGLYDILIAFTFCYSFFSLSKVTGSPVIADNLMHEQSLKSLLSICLAQGFILLYDWPKKGEPSLNKLDYLVLFVPLAGLFGLYYAPEKYSEWGMVLTMFLVAIVYTCKVKVASNKYKEEKQFC